MKKQCSALHFSIIIRIGCIHHQKRSKLCLWFESCATWDRESMSHGELQHVYTFFCTSRLLYLLRKLKLIPAIKHARLCNSIWKIYPIPLQLGKCSLIFLLPISMFRLTKNSFCNLKNIFGWHKEIQFLTNCVWLGLWELYKNSHCIYTLHPWSSVKLTFFLNWDYALGFFLFHWTQDRYHG